MVHPDKGGSQEAFVETLQAYEVLSSSRLRAAYDATLCGKDPGRDSNDGGRGGVAVKRRRKESTGTGVATDSSRSRTNDGQSHATPSLVLQSALKRLHTALDPLEARSVGWRT